MGMAASQARFLGLTARKTNVEYEGQQVNQQRTALANESAGLFNQMLELKVPTPPSATSYYNTNYTFSYGADDNFSIGTISPNPAEAGKFDIELKYVVSTPTGYNDRAISQGTIINFIENVPKTITFPKVGDKGEQQTINFVQAFPVNDKFASDADKTNLEAIWKSFSSKGAYAPEGSTGDRDCSEETWYKYTKDGSTFYISSHEYMGVVPSGGNGNYDNGLTQYYRKDKDDKKKTTATATFGVTPDGRYDSVFIQQVVTDGMSEEEAKKLNEMAGRSFELDLKQVNDDEGFQEAMKDYEYEKMLYERSVQDINARTEIIQQQDRTLELRLKQLDTEQEALKTEMDAVKDVIQKNVESTFKTFA